MKAAHTTEPGKTMVLFSGTGKWGEDVLRKIGLDIKDMISTLGLPKLVLNPPSKGTFSQEFKIEPLYAGNKQEHL